MRPNRSLLAVALVMVTGVVTLVTAAPAMAAKGRSSSRAPAPPPPGWVVDRVRFEPIDPAGEIDIAGGGAYAGALEVGNPVPSTPLAITVVTVPEKPARGAKKGRSITTSTTVPRTTTTTVRRATTTTVRKGSTKAAPSSGPVAIVNDVSLDDYVSGIAEVPSSWPAEALKAQAIAARTYALHELSVGHTLCATDACQVYAGLAKQRAAGGDNWLAAVAATTRQVVVYKDQPILAMYSSSDGGHTIAGSMPYLKAVDDPDDSVSPLSHWVVTVPFDVLTSLFSTPAPVIDVHRTAHDTVDLIWNNEDGTTGDLDVATSDFGARLNSQPAPAGLPRAVPSLRFDLVVDQQAGTLTIDGQGYGHGIGMSQFGAMGKASRGMSASDILAAYYGGLKPTTATPAELPATVRVTLQAAVSSTVSVSSPGPFRVLAGDGRVLANLASGSWQVVPTTGGVRVVAPANQADPPSVVVSALDARAGAAPTVRFTTNIAGLVSVAVQPPGRAVVATPAALTDAGEHSVTLPSGVVGTVDGTWSVTVGIDAGAGRTATVPATFTVGAPPSRFERNVPPAVSRTQSRLAMVKVQRSEGTPLAVGMTGVAACALLLGVGGVLGGQRRLREADPTRLV